MDSRAPLVNDDEVESSHTNRVLTTTEIPAQDVPKVRIELSKIAGLVKTYSASYGIDLILLHVAPESIQNVMKWGRHHYVGFEPLIGSAIVSGYKALDYIETANLPFHIMNAMNRLAGDIVYAEATGAIYCAVNHCLLNRVVEPAERAAWNIVAPALMRGAVSTIYNACKRGSFFSSGVKMPDGQYATYYITQGGYAVDPREYIRSIGGLGDPLYTPVDNGDGHRPLMGRSSFT
jgi:hypothetical protein